MKTTIIVLSSIILSLSANKMDCLAADKENFIQIQTIKDVCIKDSIRVIYQVIVDFAFPFEDTTKNTIVNAVSLNKIYILKPNEKPGRKTLLYKCDKLTQFQDKIWKLCENKLSDFYKFRLYDNYPFSRKGLGNRVSFGGEIYFVPIVQPGLP